MSLKNFIIVIFVVTSALLINAATSNIGCRDESNKVVDYFYVYKLPQDPPGQFGPEKSDGLRYAYKTSKTVNDDQWIDSSIKISDKQSMLGLTLSQMYGDTRIIAILYNDQMPIGKDDEAKGHAKGVLVTNKKQGFWLIHSVPQYPPTLEEDKYSYPETGKKYGQSFLCITMTAAEIDKASIQLMMNQVQIYSSRLPKRLESDFPNIEKLINGVSVLQLKSINGTEFTSFAKSSDFQKDLYSELIAPSLKSNLNVETWRNGRQDNNLPPTLVAGSYSRKYLVSPVSEVSIPELDYKFSTHRDHSKWAVSSDSSKDWICVGDINYQKSQAKRGGGTVCQASKSIAEAYRHVISGIISGDESE